MNIIIPGGAGFVGRNFLGVLNSENYDMHTVTVLDKNEKNLEYVKRFGVTARYVDLAETGVACGVFAWAPRFKDWLKDADFIFWLGTVRS
jgi:nucleoside-diphosphate-sugar epimerase